MSRDLTIRSDASSNVPRPEPDADEWSVGLLAHALLAVEHDFQAEVPGINALNVFPVPDGDTGTNMHLTLKAMCDEIPADESLPSRVDELMKQVTRGALMGARGNSGVILYQIIAGLSAGFEEREVLDATGLARGLDWAADMVYRAVNNPVEGTMLSVIRHTAESCHEFTQTPATILQVLQTARSAAAEALDRTPDQLPVLRQAGVVDAGGKGLLTILSSLERYASGEISAIEDHHPAPPRFASDMHFLDQAEVIHGLEEFGYCINFVVTGERLESRGIRHTLDALGTSTVIVGDDEMMKVHTHSEQPGTILQAALTFGELHEIRIDNMKAQTERLLAERSATVEQYQFAPPSEVPLSIGIVAVGSGSGIIDALKGMGANVVVTGGASMNPSTGEIRDAIESLDVTDVLVLPNDANILASARHAANHSTRNVRVVPTTSIQQGIAALASFNFERPLDDNAAAMAEAVNLVRSLAVARASRDVEIDELSFRSGEYMGIVDGTPRVTGADLNTVIIELFTIAEADDFELATIFLGEAADGALEETLPDLFADQFPELEVEIAQGGQPHYDLLIALE